MASTFTTNKSIEQPGNNDYINTWNVPVNADWAIIDKAFGGTTTLTGTSGTATLTATQYQSLILSSTAALTGNITYRLPSGVGGQWVVDNRTTGSFTFTVSSLGGGASVVCAQNARTLIFSDGTNVRLSNDTSIVQGTGITVAGSTISLTAPVTSALGGTGFTTYTTGDIIYASGTNTLSKLAAGTAGYVLTMAGGVPTWAVAGGGTGGSGTVTSITVTGGTTGLTFTPTTPITTSGTFSMLGTLAVTNGGTGGVDQASAQAGLGLGTIATQNSNNVSITGGSMSSVSISGGTASNLTTARIGTSSALSGAETVSVLAPTSTDGVVSKVTTNTNYNFVGQNSSGTENFVVSGNGKVIVGNTTTGTGGSFTGAQGRFNAPDEWALEAYQSATTNVTYGALAVRVNNTLNPLVEFFYGLSGNPLSVSTVGTIDTDGTGVSYNTVSDYRLKENVSDFSGGVDVVKQLRPASFTWKNNPSLGPVTGFIAHEVQAVVPQAVTGEKDAVTANGSVRAQVIDHSKLVPVLTAAIKELVARVEELEARLA